MLSGTREKTAVSWTQKSTTGPTSLSFHDGLGKQEAQSWLRLKEEQERGDKREKWEEEEERKKRKGKEGDRSRQEWERGRRAAGVS